MKMHDTPFAFIGNNLAVDFINTEMVSRGQLVDLLQDSADLVAWAHDANLDFDGDMDPAGLATALDFRKALKDLYTAKIDKLSVPHKALATLNRHLADHSTQQVLQLKKEEYQLRPAQNRLSLPMLLGRIANDAAALLASPQAQKLKRCSNPDCVLIFLDTSRNQKRRWCSMETCGNRAKVSTHYRKNQS